MAHLPTAGVELGEKRQDFLAVRLGADVLRVLGHVADKEVRVAEHHKVLLGPCLLVGEQLCARHVEQLDGHAARIADAVELRVGVAVGQPHHGLPGLARFGKDTLAQCGVEVGQHLDFGLHATVGLGMGIA